MKNAAFDISESGTACFGNAMVIFFSFEVDDLRSRNNGTLAFNVSPEGKKLFKLHLVYIIEKCVEPQLSQVFLHSPPPQFFKVT